MIKKGNLLLLSNTISMLRFDANEHNLIATMFEGLSGNRANYHHGAIESSHQKFIDYSTFVRIQWLPKRTYLIKRDVT